MTSADLISVVIGPCVADCVCGEESDIWRNLPQCGLHPLQGTAQQLTLLPHGQEQRLCRARHRGTADLFHFT